MPSTHLRPERLPLARATCFLFLLAMGACAGRSSDPAASGLPSPGEVTEHAVTVTEGTNMAAAAAPDGGTMALAIQGSLWTVPAERDAVRRLATWESRYRRSQEAVPGRRGDFSWTGISANGTACASWLPHCPSGNGDPRSGN